MIIKKAESPVSFANTRIKLMIALLVMVVVCSASLLNNSAITGYFISTYAKFTTYPSTLSLDIKFKHLLIIDKEINLSSSQGARVASQNTWVPAKINFNDKQIPVKIRLKGAFSDHWSSDKFSLNVRVKSDNALMGMKEFSLVSPETREFIYEPLFHQILKSEGEIYHRTKFISLAINGDKKGIFLLIERPSKNMVENSRRREGPLLQFDKSLWLEYRQRGVRPPPADSYSNSFVKPANSKEFKKQNLANFPFSESVAALEEFKKGKLAANDVFDIDSIARVAALFALFGSYEFDWKDQVFYYNLQTSLLETVGKEVHVARSILQHGWWYGHERSPDRKAFIQHLFSDKEFVARYFFYLDKYTTPKFLSKMEETFSGFVEEGLNVLKREYPFVRSPWGKIKKNALTIKAKLYEKYKVQAFINENDGSKSNLLIRSYHNFHVQLLSISDQDKKKIVSFEKLVIPPSIGGYNEIIVENIEAKSLGAGEDFSLTYKVGGLGGGFKTRVHKWWPLQKSTALKSTPYTDLERYFLVNRRAKIISCKNESTEIDRQIIFPEEVRFECINKKEIVFKEGASLVVRGAVAIRGNANQRLKLKGDLGAGGLLIMGAIEESEIDFAEFSNLGVVKSKFLRVTGAVTFYESDVKISDSIFQGNKGGDDNLNIVRSKANLSQLKFMDSAYDALDLDFVRGHLVDIEFYDSGNDALDVSGSQLSVENIKAQRTGDKAVSAGEASDLEISSIEIDSSSLGIASKDGSMVKANGIHIKNVGVAFSAYQKKGEYSGGRLYLSDVIIGENVVEIESEDLGSNIDWFK